MADLILVTGGARSGKSGYALGRANALGGHRTFIATCPVLDDEMAARVEAHRAERAGTGWRTVETETDLAGAIRDADAQVLLVDCLTLWINNLLYQAEQNGDTLSEADVAAACRGVLAACAETEATIFLVTNEVGMGIAPENALARRFRDLAGRCNQVMATAAETVVLLISGQPVAVKGALK